MTVPATLAALRSIATPEDAPVTVMIADSSGLPTPVQITRLTRVLKGRRFSGWARWQDRNVFAKVFVGDAAAADWGTEIDGHRLLTDAGVRTSDLLLKQSTSDGARVCLYAMLGTGVTLKRLLDDPATSESDAIDALKAAVSALAACHDHGLIHTDPHLDNFVTHLGVVHAVDTAGIVRSGTIRFTAVARRNLARFLATLPPRLSGTLPDLIDHYRAARTGTGSAGTATWLRAVGRRTRVAQWRYVHGKALRECTEFAAYRTDTEFCVYRRSDESTALLQVLSDLSANRLTPGPIELPDRVIDACFCPAAGLRRIRAFGPGRRRWVLANLLSINDVAAPRPIALLERGRGGLATGAWVVLHSDTDLNLADALADASQAEASALVADTRRLVEQLTGLGVRFTNLTTEDFAVAGGKTVVARLEHMTWWGLPWPDRRSLDVTAGFFARLRPAPDNGPVHDRARPSAAEARPPQ